ncbi:MAG: hypothetical protein SGILL_001545 [Bacillariaceae sp.]
MNRSSSSSSSSSNVPAVPGPVSFPLRHTHHHHPHYSMDGQTMVTDFDWEPRPLHPRRDHQREASVANTSNNSNRTTLENSVSPSLFADRLHRSMSSSSSSRNLSGSSNGTFAIRSASKVSADCITSTADDDDGGGGGFDPSDWDYSDDIESIAGVDASNPDDEFVVSSSGVKDKDGGWFDRLPEEDEDPTKHDDAASKPRSLDQSLSNAAIAIAAEEACPLLQQAVDMIISGSSRGTSDQSQQGLDDDCVLGDEEDDGSQAGAGPERFRDYQAGQWSRQFQQLVEYKNRHGHVCVPHTSRDAPSLGRWVKRQRYQYKLFQDGRTGSTMTQDRIDALESIGFVWESHEGTWEARYRELQQFHQQYGHSNVPSKYPNNKLATWVKYQRRIFKLQKNREAAHHRTTSTSSSSHKASHASLTADRTKKLLALGFEWQLRRCRGGAK